MSPTPDPPATRIWLIAPNDTPPEGRGYTGGGDGEMDSRDVFGWVRGVWGYEGDLFERWSWFSKLEIQDGIHLNFVENSGNVEY